MMREISPEEAKPIWDRFVSEKQVWTDDWDIRIALCKTFGYKPLILYDGKNFFPLQLDPEKGFHELIGGESVEKNYVTFDPDFMKRTDEIPENIYFDFLGKRFDGCMEGVCPQFFIDLNGIGGIEDYVKRFSKKHQKNFMRALRLFGPYEFKRQGTLDEMAHLNIGMFGKESDFAGENRGAYEILDKDPRTEYWSIVKGGKTVSITQYFFFGRTMAVCVWGVGGDYAETIKISLVEAIKLAKSRGCDRIDYAPNYSGWKFFYRLDISPLWRYKRGNIPDSVDRTGV